MHNPCGYGRLRQLSQHTTTGKTSPSGKRIFIPQERVIIERPIPPKVEPASYRAWLNTGDHYERVREYEKFLAGHDVAGIVPSFELLRSARDWQNVAVQNMLFQTVNFGITLYRPYASLNI